LKGGIFPQAVTHHSGRLDTPGIPQTSQGYLDAHKANLSLHRGQQGDVTYTAIDKRKEGKEALLSSNTVKMDNVCSELA
jgi:hypothetical protein